MFFLWHSSVAVSFDFCDWPICQYKVRANSLALPRSAKSLHISPNSIISSKCDHRGLVCSSTQIFPFDQIFSVTLTLNLINVFNVIFYPFFFYIYIYIMTHQSGRFEVSQWPSKIWCNLWDFAAVREGQTDNRVWEVVFKIRNKVYVSLNIHSCKPKNIFIVSH